MAIETKFWVVWRENGGAPQHKHLSFQEAKNEAMRLAAEIKWRFYVLECVGKAETQSPPIVYREMDTIAQVGGAS